ncbi:MAG: hypothetical protein FJ399_00970 [Verrucomicrobia bacterium]|nr:hypothetical protein [Verrucomicrobiota bacterium]
MTAADIRTALHSNRPFKVRTADGKVIKVPHQDFAALSRNGRTLVVMTEKTWEVLDVLLISAIEMKPAPTAA